MAPDLPEGGARPDGIGVRDRPDPHRSLAAVLSAEGDHDGPEALLEELIAEPPARAGPRRPSTLPCS